MCKAFVMNIYIYYQCVKLGTLVCCLLLNSVTTVSTSFCMIIFECIINFSHAGVPLLMCWLIHVNVGGISA